MAPVVAFLPMRRDFAIKGVMVSRPLALFLLLPCILFSPSGGFGQDGSLAAARQIAVGVSEFQLGQGGKVQAGPGKVWLMRPGPQPGGPWSLKEIVDKDSQVTHRALLLDLDGDGRRSLLTAGGSHPLLKLYREEKGGWHPEILWEPPPGDGTARLRDFRVGDTDGDGRPEILIGTHPKGLVAVLKREGGAWKALELSREERTWVHEVAIGKVDPKGPPHLFATLSHPNVLPGRPQPGRIAAWRWEGGRYRASVVESFSTTHAKEIEVWDLDGDGRAELVAAIEGVTREVGGRVELLEPVRIKAYRWEGGRWTSEVLAEIPDVSGRAIAIGDADNDGRPDVVLGARSAGLWLLTFDLRERRWRKTLIDRESAGINHPLLIADIDGDRKNELYAAADVQGQISRYDWRGGRREKSLVLQIPKEHWTWAMEASR